MSRRSICTVALFAMLVGAGGMLFAQDASDQDSSSRDASAKTQAEPYPTPSVYPVSWQFDFEHSEPKRVVLETPGRGVADAYWYVTYRVTNNTDQERVFLPVFEMLTESGQLLRSDNGIPAAVFEAIKGRERSEFLQTQAQIGGRLRLGEDQAKDGVAIWKEPTAEMGRFSIFVGGLSGEAATIKIGDKQFRLRKTLKLDYLVRGDEIQPHQDRVTSVGKDWVMR